MKKNRSSNGTPSNGAPGGGIRKRKPQLLALEQRMMFDGAGAATAPEPAAHAPDAIEHLLARAAASEAPAAAAPSAVEKAVEQLGALLGVQAQAGKEIVFVDTTVADWQALLAGVRDGVEVALLAPERDAFVQIAERLQGERELAAVHLVTHGVEGALVIGGASFDSAALATHAEQLAVIGRALAADGDILLYGCDVAAGSGGAAFVQALSQSTGADVAASTDTTGSARAWAGDWVLEARSGEVEASLFAAADALAQYEHKLATIDLSGSTGWTPIMFGNSQDPQGDSQAKAADTDIVADGTHGSLYTAYDDNGTAGTADDSLAFRLRVDNPTDPTSFQGVAVVGIDANMDGRIDLYCSARVCSVLILRRRPKRLLLW